jgi:hypothetical protein
MILLNFFINLLYLLKNKGLTIRSKRANTKKQRIDNKIQARKVAFMADWEEFAKYYIEAHNMAVEKNK